MSFKVGVCSECPNHTKLGQFVRPLYFDIAVRFASRSLIYYCFRSFFFVIISREIIFDNLVVRELLWDITVEAILCKFVRIICYNLIISI